MGYNYYIGFTIFYTFYPFFTATEAQFNVYGLNLELIKMRPGGQQPLFVQQFQLQVDYTHNNKVIDYGVVTVNSVQDRADLIFLESINRNPFHLPRVESDGDLCFRVFVQNGQILFDDCLQVRDLPNNAYYNSKYVTRTKNDGGLLMYKVIQYMVENRDQTRAMLEQSFVNAQINGLLAKCPCTMQTIIASFEAALILALLIFLAYWKFRKFKSNKVGSNQTAIKTLGNFEKTAARLNNVIYSENSTTEASSIGWSIKESTSPSSPYYSDVMLAAADQQQQQQQHSQKKIQYRSSKNDSAAISAKNFFSHNGESRNHHIHSLEEADPIPRQLPDFGAKKKQPMPTFSRSILEQILKPKSAKSKKQPPKPPPPDYKNDAFEDESSSDGSFNINSNHHSNDEERVYDCLEKPKV